MHQITTDHPNGAAAAVPGRMDAATGAITPARLNAPAVDDPVDELVEVVLRARGKVVVVPADRMPGECGLAAILRH